MDAAWSVKAVARSGGFPTARRERLEQPFPGRAVKQRSDG